ncbi:competence protein CoiA [Bacillus sp. KH172YL63]|uniref:competence protein CoiA n=1 Tax=Bacillus sp. KH172YL63 TaxID=2709784 RepID=UPI0013E4E1DA|nr:competence protein CoiA family protein [Bacillus sp. KH172YL63]BCB03046.1 hypothetical protein KH172YL63_11790 [Bacillus sp. KH172YL63]
MLTALLNQRAFTTIHYSREELRIVKRRDLRFRCPHCSESVNLRIGHKNVPHFSHVSRTDCLLVGRESPTHLLGKELLYEKLRSMYEHVEVEHYIAGLNQVADLYVETGSRKIAVEIQCSTIPLSELAQRTSGYHSLGITPYWLLTQEVRKNGMLSLTSFQQAFIRYSPSLHYFLLQFLPEKKGFQLFFHLIPTSSSAFLCSAPVHIPFTQFSLPLTIQPSLIHSPYSLKDWYHYRTKWIRSKVHYYQGKKDPFLKEVYHDGDTFLYLPLYVGLPVLPHGTLIKTHSVQWQYYVWRDCLKKGTFTVKAVLDSLHQRVKKGDIELRTFVNADADQALDRVVKGYLDSLEKLGVIGQGSRGEFLAAPWKCPDQFSAFERHYEEFMPKWRHFIKTLMHSYRDGT